MKTLMSHEQKRLREQCDAEAQYNLGVLYETGQCVPQDYTKARQWYEKAAAQGHEEAQYNLGVMYAEGEGVSMDYTKARQWFEQAAAQGHPAAQEGLMTLIEITRGRSSAA
jgi:hypothetical protein